MTQARAAAPPHSRATSPAGGSIPGGTDVWERWLPAWHVYNLAVLGLSTAFAFGTGALTPTASAIAGLVVVVLVLAYIRFWVTRALWNGRDRTRLAYGLLLLVAFAVLLLLARPFAFLQLALYAQLFFSLPRPPVAVAAGFSVGVILALAELINDDGNVGAALPGMVLGLAQGAAFTMLSAWIGAIIAQSGQRQALLSELALTRAELAAAEREAGALEERARLSREIHDTLAQGFTSVVMHLEAADAVLDADVARARSHVHAAEAVGRASLDEARRLVWALRPRALEDGGLPAALTRVVGAPVGTAAGALPGLGGALVDGGPAGAPDPGSTTAGPAVDLTIAGQPRSLHPEVEVTLLRAAQEALANAQRHAGASRVSLTLTYFDDTVSLDVVDDGRGFAPEALAAPGPKGGHGLPGMRERAERLGGTVEIESAPGEGTVVAVQLPAPAVDPADGARPGPTIAAPGIPVGALPGAEA